MLPANLTSEQLNRMYYFMRLGRALEERLEILYRQGAFPSAVYSGRGQEACYVGSAFALQPGDVMAPSHRDVIAQLPLGMSVRGIMAQHYGKVTSPTRGKGEATYLGDLELGIMTTVSMLPDFYPVCTGVALAFKMRRENRVAVAYCGEGASSRGDFHEALNMAAVMQLPVVFFVVNNQFAYSTPIDKEMRIANVSQRAAAYDMPGKTVDGNDVLAVYEATKEAVDQARQGGGPTLIEGKTMRMRGHAGHDPADYVPKELIKEWEAKDPIEGFEKFLFEGGQLTPKARDKLVQEITAVVDDAVKFAEESPYPRPEEALLDVYG